MNLTLETDGVTWTVATDQAISCAMTQHFDARQPSAFGLPAARSAPAHLYGWTGEIAAGSPVRCHTVTITPHDNGTHTESARHIGLAAPSPAACAGAGLFPCALLWVTPEPLHTTGESVRTPLAEGSDRVVSARLLQDAARHVGFTTFPSAVMVGLLPHDRGRAWRRWGQDTPYLTREAVILLAEAGVRHLLLEMPSIDRLQDGGLVDNHQTWWSHPGPGPESPALRTLTEMVAPPTDAPAGHWLLHLSVAPWDADAAPSHPWLLPLRREPSAESTT